MTTKQYIKKFNLDNPDFSNHFNTDLFLQVFGAEFLNKLNNTLEMRRRNGLVLEYRIFQQAIKEIQDKFISISNHKVGGPLRKELWGAFYAKYVIPYRSKNFPKEHEEIQKVRDEVAKKRIRKSIIDEWFGFEGNEYLIWIKDEEPGQYEIYMKQVEEEVENRLSRERGGE